MPADPTPGPARPGDHHPGADASTDGAADAGGSPRGGAGWAVRATRALVAAVLVVLVLVTLVTALFGHGQTQGDAEGAGHTDGTRVGAASAPPSPAPSTVADLPPVLSPLADLAAAPEPAPPAAAGLARALAGPLADPALGPRVTAAVVDVTSGELLYAASPPGEPGVLPASTSKLVTAAAALAVLDPAQRLVTRVVPGADPGELVLVGGGDPTLAGLAAGEGLRYGGTPPARLSALADATAASLAARGVREVSRLTVDATLFGPPGLAPGWRPTYLTDGNVAPVVALSVDAGRVRPGRLARHPDPVLAAGRAFAALLAERGVTVGEPVAGVAPSGAAELAVAESPPVAGLVETMLSASDNDIAEALARHVALALGLPPTADGAAEALRVGAARLGLAPDEVRVADGSGLSRDSRVRPEAVARLVARAARPHEARLRSLVTGLPVAGFAGTLAERYRGGPQAAAAGSAWAKTGTLSGVNALAGLVVDAQGRLLAFDVTADAVPGGARPAEAALDRVVATLAACGCA